MPRVEEVVDYNSSNLLDQFVNSSTESGTNPLNDWLAFGELTDDSNTVYNTVKQRQPLSFPIYKEKSIRNANADSLGNLPLTLFWSRLPKIDHYHKNTGK